MTPKKAYALRLEPADAERFDEICARNRIKAQQALEQAAREYIAREMRYLKGKEECRAALHAYLQTGETIEEDEMERFVAERLRSNGVEL